MKTLKLNEEQFRQLNLLNAKAQLAKREYEHEQEKITAYVQATLNAAGVNTPQSVKITDEGIVYEPVGQNGVQEAEVIS